jgi:hypothetical protein
MDASASVQHLADQLGVTVDRARFHARASSKPVMTFIALAATVAYATSIQQTHDERIGAALDVAAGSAGSADTDVPALLHAVSIEYSGRRDQTVVRAIVAARALLGDLLRLGAVQ